MTHVTLEAFGKLPWGAKGRKAARGRQHHRNITRQRSKYQGKWAPIDEAEELSAGNIDSINLVSGKDKADGYWEALRITVDSGAVDTVGPKGMVLGILIKDTEA